MRSGARLTGQARLLPLLGALLASLARADDAGKELAKAAPHPRPEWVIWTVLGAILLVLFFILFGTQGGWRGKSGKSEPPYF